MSYVALGDLISKAKVERCGSRIFPVLSMTMHNGILFQNDRFKKDVASVDRSNYSVVKRNQLVVSFPIDEGVLAVQDITDAGIVSPAYKIWDIRQDLVLPKYLETWLRSPRSIEYYKSKLRGTTARRRSIPEGDFLQMPIAVPSLSIQAHAIDLINRVKSILDKRNEELKSFDDLIKARFVEMFGDPETNPKGWKKGLLKDHADVMVGYPFPSDGYSEKGIDIVGGYNLMQGYIQWEESKRWPNVHGYEQYLLQANDIVMAMDRPWVNGGFKIARIDASHLPAILIQRTACIRGRNMEQEFLYSLLDSQRFAEHCNITGSLVPHISNKDINSFQVIIPPMDLQKQYAAFITQVDKSKFAIQQALNETQKLFDSLMQQYFG